ncbi:MAG: glycosyltransferase family 2 protein [Bacteroidia bacterium]|nr:glycosyltransferase family 2 protein [Bacteroidia bacterium]
MVYICIPVHNRIEYTLECISSIRAKAKVCFTIVICDDGSTDGTSNILRENFPEGVLLNGDGKLWWTGGMNRCVEYVLEHSLDTADVVFSMNNDAVIDDRTFSSLLDAHHKSPKAIIGCVNLFYNERTKIEPSATRKTRRLGIPFYLIYNKWGEDVRKYQGLHAVHGLSGKGVLIPISVFRKIGLYNQEKLPHYHADTEFTIRATNVGIPVYISYESRVYSHQKDTGLASKANKPEIGVFVRSFSNIKSTRHLRSLSNSCKLIYGPVWHRFYFFAHLAAILVGFGQRYWKYKLSIDGRHQKPEAV